MKFIDSVTPGDLSILANITALILAEGRDSDELNVLGNFVTAVGALLLTIAAQQQSLESIQKNNLEVKNNKNNN